MKKASCVLIIVLLLLLEISANVLYPVWQIECDYAFDPAKQLSPDESYPVMERMHYSTMIVNAQTGEFMNPVNLKDRLLDVPKVTPWKDVR